MAKDDRFPGLLFIPQPPRLKRSTHPAVAAPMLCWQLAYPPLSIVVTAHWGASLQVSWHLTGCGRWPGCVGSHLFPLEAGPFWSVCPPPGAPHPLCLPTNPPLSPSPVRSPHRSSPPARLTDRQMLSAVHLQLWASITLHKQPHCSHTGCKFRLPLSPADKGRYQ